MRAIKNIRLKQYDYSSDGYYFVTICTDYLKPYLVGPTKSVVAQFIGQTFGSKQDNCLINQATTEQKYIPGVKLDWHTIMPTHVHLILILESCSLKLGEIIRRFKARTSKEIGLGIWQPNYYEHVIRNEAALNKIREYIQNNPKAREIEFEEFYKKEHDKSGDKQEPDKSGNYR